jgi:hypothetical protein
VVKLVVMKIGKNGLEVEVKPLFMLEFGLQGVSMRFHGPQSRKQTGRREPYA